MDGELDKIDLHILQRMQTNARISNVDLARELEMAPSAVLERVKKLEQSGLIKSYHATLDKEKLGLGVNIFILVSLSSHKMNQIKAFVDKINTIKEVVECHHITGQGDFLLKVLVKDIPAYQSLILDTLSQIEEIGNMQSMVALSTFKDSKVLPIP